MALSKDDVLNAIAEMSVMDIVELISAMEEKSVNYFSQIYR